MNLGTKTLLAVLACSLTVASHAQPGGGGSSGIDNNPWNPLNWDVSYYSNATGLTIYEGWYMENGVPVDYIDTWVWGAPLAPMFPGAGNSTGSNRTVSATAEGVVTRRIRWIGQGTAPDKILIKISAEAGAGGGPFLDYANASNGLGHPNDTIIDILDLNDGLASSGFRYKLISIDQLTGVSEDIILSQFAEATCSGIGSYADVRIPVHTIQIAEKAVGVHPFISPTYKVTYGPQPDQLNQTLIQNKYVDDIELVSSISESNGFFYFLQAGIYSDHYGSWVQPIYTSMSPPDPSDQSHAYIYKEYSSSEFESIMRGSPDIITLTTTSNDGYHTRSGIAKLFIYTPIHNLTKVSEELVYSSWTRISARYHVPAGGSINLQHTITTANSHTTGVTWTGGVTIPISITEIIGIDLSGSGSWVNNETAVISHSTSADLPFTNPESHGVFAYLIRRSFNKRATGTCEQYNQNGFVGGAVIYVDHFASGSKEQAEIKDFDVSYAYDDDVPL